MEVADESEAGEDMEDQDEGVENIEEDVIDNVAASEPSMASAQSITDALTVPTRVRMRYYFLLRACSSEPLKPSSEFQKKKASKNRIHDFQKIEILKI